MMGPGRGPEKMRLAVALWLLAVLLVAPAARAAAPGPDDEEIRLGQQYARQLEQQFRVVNDAATTARVQRIGKEVAAASERPNLPYTFKVLDLDGPNALALPGGFIYVTKGMMKFVRTDHELAAVLAHEVQHVVRRHNIEMMRRQGQAQFYSILIGVLARSADVVTGARMIATAFLSAYTREMEREADLLAIVTLQRTKYTPVAVLTLMERLAREELLSPQPDPGVFRDHPRVSERIAYIEAELKRLGIPIVRRPATGFLRITVRTATERGREVGELLVDNHLVLRLPGLEGGAADRVQAIGARLDRLFDDDLQPFEISAREMSSGAWGVFARQTLIVQVTPADAA
ncbi:MAG: M48 family metalloprotease, partial [Armatimonadetes bacterium]|nr:M48 family metalloprotease [Armatimonadota bacterium]